jgi:hypothetical protein
MLYLHTRYPARHPVASIPLTTSMPSITALNFSIFDPLQQRFFVIRDVVQAAREEVRAPIAPFAAAVPIRSALEVRSSIALIAAVGDHLIQIAAIPAFFSFADAI